MQIEHSTAIMSIGPRYDETMPPQMKSAIRGAVEKTIGSATLISYRSYLWVVTCRHVVAYEPISPADQYKVIINLPGRNDGVKEVMLCLKDVHFHHQDTDTDTYDIAIFPHGPVEKTNHLLDCFELQHHGCETRMASGLPVQAFGFPTASFSVDNMRRSTRMIEVNSISGRVVGSSPGDRTPFNNFNMSLVDEVSALVDDGAVDHAGGMSGGPVVLTGGNSLVGILNSTASGSLTDLNTQSEQSASAIGFTKISYVTSCIDHIIARSTA